MMRVEQVRLTIQEASFLLDCMNKCQISGLDAMRVALTVEEKLRIAFAERPPGPPPSTTSPARHPSCVCPELEASKTGLTGNWHREGCPLRSEAGGESPPPS